MLGKSFYTRKMKKIKYIYYGKKIKKNIMENFKIFF